MEITTELLKTIKERSISLFKEQTGVEPTTIEIDDDGDIKCTYSPVYETDINTENLTKRIFLNAKKLTKTNKERETETVQKTDKSLFNAEYLQKAIIKYFSDNKVPELSTNYYFKGLIEFLLKQKEKDYQ